jgi:hypothetical protein
MSKEFISKSLSVALGIIIAGSVILSVYTIHQDHKAVNQIVSFLNGQIQKSQVPAQVK